MVAIVRLIDTVITLYIWLLIAQASLSWLIAFNVINNYNQFVSRVIEFLWRITEPALRPIRRFVPPIANIDLSPAILFIIVQVVLLLVGALRVAAATL